jgi:hypothetical protein
MKSALDDSYSGTKPVWYAPCIYIGSCSRCRSSACRSAKVTGSFNLCIEGCKDFSSTNSGSLPLDLTNQFNLPCNNKIRYFADKMHRNYKKMNYEMQF